MLLRGLTERKKKRKVRRVKEGKKIEVKMVVMVIMSQQNGRSWFRKVLQSANFAEKGPHILHPTQPQKKEKKKNDDNDVIKYQVVD